MLLIANGCLNNFLLHSCFKVQCNVINDVLVWAANDEVFHIEVEKPLIIHDSVGDATKCDWDMIGKHLLESFCLDHTQFSESWMKKEYIEKVILTLLYKYTDTHCSQSIMCYIYILF